jgi:hypothetical protein
MKSIALILWLALANGKEQVVLSKHVEDMEKCQATAQALVVNHAAKGERVRYLCHEVVEEVGNVDANGNPIEPTVMHANNRKAIP